MYNDELKPRWWNGRPACAGRHEGLTAIMYLVYVLKSLSQHWFYIGLTNNKQKRLSQHNDGQVKSTKHNRPYVVIYTKKFENRVLARDYEKYLKIRSNKEKLLKTLGFLT